MKRLYIFGVFATSAIAFSQECPKRTVCSLADVFESRDGMTYDDEKKVMVMKNVDFSNEKITVCQAETITFDTISREMVVENAQRLEFFGVIAVEKPIGEPDRPKLFYRIGDDTAYLK